MKDALKISLFVNLLLCAFLFYFSTHRQMQRPPPIWLTQTNTILEHEPFRWAEIESTNYSTYIQNLRNIGCPEQTINDLILADVGQLYKTRAQRLQAQWPGSQSGLRAELQRLDAEKKSVIASLLGEKQNASMVAENQLPETKVLLPLAWQNIDLAKLNLENDQIQAIAELRQDFLNKIGGVAADPHSPDYLNRWQKAQPEIDEAMAGMIGRKAFLEYESLAVFTNQ